MSSRPVSHRLNAFMLRLMLGLAVLLQVEGIAHAAMGMRHALAAPGTIEVCTAEGTKRIAVDPALAPPDSGSEQSQAPAQDHCPACSALGGWAGAEAAPSIPGADTAVAPSFPSLPLARIATGFADHAARAPPVLR